jgi:hypothetical protein
MEFWLHVGYVFGTYMAGIMTSAAYMHRRDKKRKKVIKLLANKVVKI